MIPKIIQNPMRRFTAAVAVLLSLACAFSCKKEKGGGDTLEKIYFVDPASASMVLSQGQTGYIMYATVPESAAATAVMEWSSSDTNIAEVFNGQVTAIAPGNTVITVKCGNVSATLDVQVVPIPVTSFSVPKSMNAYMDMPTPIKLTVQPAEANAASLEWKSDNPEIAEVVIESGKAFVNAKKEGGCKITVTPYNNSEASQQISVTVYPAIFKLMRKSISGESSYVEILNDDSFDITDIGMPYEGIRCIEMIRLDGDKLLESSVEVNNENSGIVSITKRQRSESKVLLNVEEKSEVGATKVSVSLKEDDNVYTKTFTITRQKHDFTSDTKICRIYTETPVNDVEEMARNATMEVQMFPAVNAVWTSSNESVAKVVPATSDGKGFSPMAEIRTFGEYGSAEITATDESGEHTRKFTVKVSKASFPAGTKISTRVNNNYVPVGESTTIRASYDGRNAGGFGLLEASGNLSTFSNIKWTIESPSCECRLTQVGANGVIIRPISTTTFSGSKTATLVCTDDAGNTLKHKIIIASPNAFSGAHNLRVTVDGKSYTSNAKVDIGKTATIDIAKLTFDSSYDGLKWENVGVLGSVYGTTKLNNNSSGSLKSIEFTPNRKMEAMPISVEDEIGQVRKIYISSAEFQFPEGAKIYISYYKSTSTWSTSDDCLFFNNGRTYFRVGTSATDFVKSGSPVKWSCVKTYPKLNYSSTLRALPSGDASIHVLSPTSYPNDYANDDYTLVAKDAYGTEIESRFKVKKFMNFNDGCWFRLNYAADVPTLKYKFESGKDVYVTLPAKASYRVSMSFCPYEKGNSIYVNRAEIVDFEKGSVSTRTEKPAFNVKATIKSEEYARITLYDDYGNKKAFYIKHK